MTVMDTYGRDITTDMKSIAEQLAALGKETEASDLEFLHYLIGMAHTVANELLGELRRQEAANENTVASLVEATSDQG